MLTTKQLELTAKEKVLFYLLSFPSQAFTLSQLTKKLKLHKNTTSAIVKELEEEKIVKIEIIGRAWRIQATHISDKKIPYTLQLLYESNLISQIYNKIPGAKAIILFGSYRKGDDTQTSDIDIAIEIGKDQALKIETLDTFKTFGYRSDVPVNLHVFNRKRINNNLFANIVNGIVLDGFLEARP